MKSQLPPLNWLRAFEASARHLSFTQAAGELNLTQAGISKQVKLLEFLLREPLFIRRARSLELTKTGAAYLPKVRHCFERLAEGTREVFGSRHSQMLTVRSSVSFSVNWLAPRLGKFTKLHPDKPLRLVSSVWNEEFEPGQFDFDIRYGLGNWRGLMSDRLTWDTITPLCSPKLLKGSKALKKPADLINVNLLHVMGYEEGWGIWLSAAGVKNVNPGQGLQFDSSLAAFEVAGAGAGVALARSSIAEKELRSGRLAAPFALKLPVDEAFHLISQGYGRPHPDAPAFRDWIIGEANRAK
jgi:LysR family transcriptional regulator, glycine cleavage system transcriptional activator